MKESWQKIIDEYEALAKDLHNPVDTDQLQKLSKRLSLVQEPYEKIKNFLENEKKIIENEELLKDEELGELAKEENIQLNEENEKLEKEIHALLNPPDPDEYKDAILEIRAGTGGEEAALFAGEITAMYLRYAENNNFKAEIFEKNDTENGGIKEAVFAIRGKGAYGNLKYESGVHRVQRVPKTESKGRLHTSAATVFVYPEHDEQELDIPQSEMKIETFRSSGPGGQSVNTTDSAVRITHIPTGIVVSCQDEKSQHKNKEKAMGILVSRIIEKEKEEGAKKQGDERRSKIRSGDRSEKIRTWNFPQDRLTDHRIGKNFFGIKEFLAGNIDKIIEELKIADN